MLALGLVLPFLTGTSRERTTVVKDSSSVSQEKLIIPFDEHLTQVTLAVLPVFIATGSVCFLAPLNTLAILTSKSRLFYLFAIPEAIVLASVIFFGYWYHYTRKIEKAKNPIAIFNEEGIWIAEFGLVPWDHIERVSLNMAAAPFLQGAWIKIKKNSLSTIKENASLDAKGSLFLSNIFKYDYRIGLVSSSFPMEEAIAFAQRYIINQAEDKQRDIAKI